MTKTVEVTVDIKIARMMLQVAGFTGTSKMTDEEIFNKSLTMNEEYGVKSCVSNQPDMRDKVKEYIAKLDEEINRCEELYENVSINYTDPIKSLSIQCRVETLVQVKNDLESRLEELV